MPLSSVIGAQSIVKPGVCTSSTKPASPFDGQMIYMTDVDQSAVWDGSAWVGLDPSRDRNVVINGGFDIWQRGTSSTTTGNTYLADRWVRAVPTGGTQSQETSDLPSGSGFRYAWKHSASATNSYMQMGQQIEYVNCKHLQGKTVTISFWAKALNSNAGSTGLTVRTRTHATVDGGAIFAGTNTDASVTLTTSWAKYTVSRTLASTFGALSLEFVLGSHVSGDGFLLTGVQMELGAVATPFEFEDYSTTLAKCQRYYLLIAGKSAANGTHIGVGTYTTSTVMYASVHFPVQMRVKPTTDVGTGTNYFNFYRANAFDYMNTLTVTDASVNGCYLYNNSEVSGTQGDAGVLFVDNTNGYIAVSAEF